jgi:hypothetical protein
MLFVATSTMAKPIVLLEDNANNYTQTSDGYILHFNLDATSTELANLEANIANQAGSVSMTTELIQEGKYKCIYTVTHQNHPEYVHKMMMVSGFQVLTFNGQNYGINKIVDILKSYLH